MRENYWLAILDLGGGEGRGLSVQSSLSVTQALRSLVRDTMQHSRVKFVSPSGNVKSSTYNSKRKINLYILTHHFVSCILRKTRPHMQSI